MLTFAPVFFGGVCGKVRLNPLRKILEMRVEQGNRLLPPLGLNQLLQQPEQQRFVASREQSQTGFGQAVSKDRRAYAASLDLVLHQAMLLEISEMVPYSVEGDTKPGGKFFGGERL